MKDLVLNKEWLESLSESERQTLTHHFVISPFHALVKTKSSPNLLPLYQFALSAKKLYAPFEGTYETKIFFPDTTFELFGGGIPFPVVLQGLTAIFRVDFLPVKTISIDAELPQILRDVTGGDSYIIADIKGKQHANKVTDLPPTKFTPAANPKKGKKKK
jgi:hypothetical protein